MSFLANFITFASLIPIAVSDQSAKPNVTREINISPPASPRPGKQIVDAAYQSFSIEFSFMADYAGNDTHPNVFSRQVIQNLYDISGAYPVFRVGGSTQSSAIYYPNQTEAIVDPFSSVASDQPSHTLIGPSWFQSFRQFPNGTQYIYGLNFFNTVNETYYNIGNGLDQCVLEANAAYETMGNSLYAFEIGNEVDSWGNGKHRDGNWTVQRYVNQWNEFATAISRNLTGKDATRLFQGCAFEAPRHLDERTDWNVENAELDGMGADKTKTVSDHEYMGANCHYTGAGPTIEDTLFDRTNMLSRVWYHDYLGNSTADSGIKYVIGETNSISCQGAFNISDVMASAVWAIDYVMYLSSLKVSRVHFHMGTRYRYSPWQPILYNDSAPHVNPMYYGNLFNAAVFAGGNKQTEVLVNETNFGAYAVYQAGSLDAIVAVNLNIWNSTSDPVTRPYTALALTADWENAKVSRLTSPGVDIAGNITFAGQHVDENARIVGPKTYDTVADGKVLVGAGEAILVQK
ncbi:glycoside hydrolase family 79 protein [Aspergillus luchuensis CBS 106.47]|uniref:Glycoside hydrolase family 79 protein n=1 Tax=Aspergillus luchuensis (strain CBS 106.47) TaxID=1137211 RepID=A0A1M3TC09_ASPLC|nr:glycoside hydrolase family 79 protein [Aspergillus luchuensis CBS 106.47]